MKAQFSPPSSTNLHPSFFFHRTLFTALLKIVSKVLLLCWGGHCGWWNWGDAESPPLCRWEWTGCLWIAHRHWDVTDQDLIHLWIFSVFLFLSRSLSLYSLQPLQNEDMHDVLTCILLPLHLTFFFPCFFLLIALIFLFFNLTATPPLFLL